MKLVLSGKSKSMNIDKVITVNDLNPVFVNIADSVLNDAYPHGLGCALHPFETDSLSDTKFTFCPVRNEAVYKLLHFSENI